jgi:hypothetical protein
MPDPRSAQLIQPGRSSEREHSPFNDSARGDATQLRSLPALVRATFDTRDKQHDRNSR